MQEEMIETRASKKLRGIGEVDIYRLSGAQKETLQHLLSGCKKLAATELVRRHDNVLKIMAVEWGNKERLLPEKTKWYKERWEKRQLREEDRKKILWDWEHKMRTL